MRTPNRGLRWAALIAAMALLLAACGGRDDTTTAPSDDDTEDTTPSPGITDTEIKFGGSYPFSGPASAYGTIGKAADAYFKYVNEELGGVKMGDGKTRKIVFTSLDDGYAPPRAVENAKRFMEQDKVFGLFNTLGTANNVAIWDETNRQEVPQVFVATGASAFGADVEAHPFTTGWQPAYSTESAVYAQYLKEKKPNAKVGILQQNDDYGKDYVEAFKKAIEGTKVSIVATETYEVADPTVDSQVTNLSKSGADTFFNVSTPKFAAQAIKKVAETGWKPLHLLNSVSASPVAVIKPAGPQNAVGIVTATYIKDAADPQWANDAGMKQYLALAAKYAGGQFNPLDSFGVYGFAVGETLVKALEKTEKPTRAAFMKAIRSLDDVEISLLLPGVTLNMDGADDGFPIESMQIAEWTGDRFELKGKVVSFEGKTPAGDEG